MPNTKNKTNGSLIRQPPGDLIERSSDFARRSLELINVGKKHAAERDIYFYLRRRTGSGAGEYRLTMAELKERHERGDLQAMDEIWDSKERMWSYAQNIDFRKYGINASGIQTPGGNEQYVLRRRMGDAKGDYYLSPIQLLELAQGGAIHGMDEIWDPTDRSWSYFKNYEWTKLLAIELGPKDARAYYETGMAKLALKDYRAAKQDFNVAIRLNPEYALAYAWRGHVKSVLRKYTGAIQDYNKAIELNPRDARAYCGRGSAKRVLEDYTGAIQDYNRAIELDPNDEVAYAERGFLKHVLGDKTGAMQDFNIAIELGPKFARAYYGRGFAKIGLEDYTGALEDYRKAGELGMPEAYVMMEKMGWMGWT